MAITLIKDITQGAQHNARADSFFGIAYYGTRVYLAEGVTDGSANQSATALARSLASAGLPQIRTNPYPEDYTVAPNAVINNYRSEAANDTGDAIFLFADYDTELPPTSPVVFSMSDDSSLMNVQTELVPGTLTPITVDWLDPAEAAAGLAAPHPYSSAPTTRVATATATIVVRKIIYSASVANRDLDVYRAKVGCVNSDEWKGLPAGYWRFDRLCTQRDAAASVLPVSGGSFQAPVNGPIDRATQSNILNNPDQRFKTTIELNTKSVEPWQTAEVFRHPNLDRPIAPPPDEVAAARAAPYVYGIQKFNGLTLVGTSPTTPFAALFGS